ncbi:nitrogen regulation protein NR(II) [Planctomycetota bacterium]
MFAHSFGGRLRDLHFLRLVVAVIGIILLFLIADTGGSWTARLPYAILVLVCLLNLVYPMLGRRASDPRRFAALEIAIDGVLVTGLVYLTGGVYSFAAILYFGPILAAALCVSERLGIPVASAGTVSLAAIQILYHLAVNEFVSLPLVSEKVLLAHQLRVGPDAAYLIAQGLAFHTVGVLAMWLSRELRHVRILYSEILEEMAEGLIAIDQAGTIVFINTEAKRLLDYRKPESILGQDFREVFRRREDHEILDCLLSPEPETLEVDLNTREGMRAVQIRTTVLGYEHGAHRGTIGVLTDLTLRRQVEEAERNAARLVQIETLALGIAHELRNPLASIRGCAQEIGKLDYLGGDERNLAQIVCRESDRLDAIVSDFMSFARPRSPTIEPCDLLALLREVALLLEVRAEAAKVDITLDLPEEAWLEGDATLLKQVFLNLGINALEALSGRGSLQVSVQPSKVWISRSTQTKDRREKRIEKVDGYHVVFEDDGPGLSEPDLKQLFVPFYTSKPSGSGLGLPVAERIVKGHGGEISIRSRKGEGMRAVVRLPLRSAVEKGSPVVDHKLSSIPPSSHSS